MEGETNRATIATMNAELRRGKNAILTGDVPRLEKLAAKRGKGVTKEIVAERQGLVRELVRQIQSVPDGVSSSIRNFKSQQAGRAGGGLELSEIRIEERGGGSSGIDMSTTEQSEAFAQEWDERKKKQEESLNVISQGLNTLKSMAGDIGEELDRQDPLLREIEKKVDGANEGLKTNNPRLKEMVTKLRSSRNFCVDVVLLCILLGIGAYIYSLVK